MSEASSFVSSPAGPSASCLNQSQPPPPPESIQRDDYAAADEARRRLSRRGLFSSVSLPSLRKRRSKAHKRESSPTPPSLAGTQASVSTSASAPTIPEFVSISGASDVAAELDGDYDKDVYRWAILYENQRGAMVFSTPYYSAFTLLPLDPPAFTIPTTTRSPRKNQPTVSLEDYPLPDGSWKWISRAWMIDMRGDGQVQYDGFEYSRSFRSKKWGPDPGFMSNRGLVRRRRWIRLMMRPARIQRDDAGSVFSTPGALSGVPQIVHEEEGATRPPSVIIDLDDDDEGGVGVWKGDEGDWDRCHAAMRRLGRDGRKLELWASWLGVKEGTLLSHKPSPSPSISLPPAKGDPRNTQEGSTGPDSHTETEADKLTADTGVNISQAPRSYVAAVVRAHGSDILGLFVYPDSRAKLVQYLSRAGLLPELQAGLGVSESVRALDFWSYTQDLETSMSSLSVGRT